MYRKMASFSIRYSSWVISSWILVTGFFVSFAVQLPNVIGDHGLATEGQYAQVQEIISREFHISDEPVILLFDNHVGRPKRAFHSFIMRTLDHIERISGVDVASSPLERQGMEKGKYAYALISIPGSIHEKRLAIEQIREKTSGDRNFVVTMT
jgi:RND superfamily putative drug exporter